MHIFLEITSKIAFYQNSFLYNNHNFPQSTFVKKNSHFSTIKIKFGPFPGLQKFKCCTKILRQSPCRKGWFCPQCDSHAWIQVHLCDQKWCHGKWWTCRLHKKRFALSSPRRAEVAFWGNELPWCWRNGHLTYARNCIHDKRRKRELSGPVKLKPVNWKKQYVFRR